MKIAALLGGVLVGAAAATAESQQESVRAYRVAHEQELMAEYRELVAIPNVGADQPNIRRNAQFLVGMMQRRGIAATLLEGKSPAANPAVFGEIQVPGATRTVIFYAHYDGMPVNPSDWSEGLDPWNPLFLTAPLGRGGRIISEWKPGDRIDPNWRLNGRAAADDKAGIFSILNAYTALVASGRQPSVNVKFFFDGEEEFGSPHLREILELHRARLASDLWIIGDGPRPASGRKSVVFGVRGDVNVELTAYGAKRPLHSGNYGNWAPNPADGLVALLASMKDGNGRVLIAGFYDDVVRYSESERIAVLDGSTSDDAMIKELGFQAPEQPGRTLLEGFELPGLNINGLTAASTGKTATNIIPTVARVNLDLRLVLGVDWRRQVERVVAHIQAAGWHVIDHEPTDAERADFPKLIKLQVGAGYNAQRTPMSLPIAKSVIAAVQSTTAEPIMKQPTLGGSLPLSVVEETLGAKVISVPVVNFDNNQHAENENMLIQYLWEGMETYAALMTMP